MERGERREEEDEEEDEEEEEVLQSVGLAEASCSLLLPV